MHTQTQRSAAAVCSACGSGQTTIVERRQNTNKSVLERRQCLDCGELSDREVAASEAGGQRHARWQ